jgi:quercetin dioxygenase-like cupin family protein
MTDAHTGSPDPADAQLPRILCNAESLAAEDFARAGALWRLTEPGRQLDANVVRIPPGGRIDTHTEPDLDVLLFVVAGDGTLGTAQDRQPLTPGSVTWLPHGTARSLTAGKDGMSYLTVHRRRPGMRIRTQPQA